MTDPTPVNFEQEPRIVDEIAVLDLDRTLLNSSAVMKLILAELASHGVKADRIDEAIAYVEAQTGNSFHLFDYIEREFSTNALEAIITSVMQDNALLEEIKQDLLCPGADMLVDALEEQGTPCMILTFGEENFQGFKVAVFRKLIGKTAEELPAIVTQTGNKSQWVQDAWFNEGGEFGEIPESVFGEALFARVVSIVDDKTSNLQSSDERVTGVLVDNRKPAIQGVISTLELAEVVTSGAHIFEVAGAYEEREEAAVNKLDRNNNVYHVDFAHNVKDDDSEFEKWAS